MIQDLRDAVRERLKRQSGVEDLHLHGLRPGPLVQIPARLLDYRGGLSFDQNMRRSLAPPPDWLVWQWADERRKLSRKHAKRAGGGARPVPTAGHPSHDVRTSRARSTLSTGRKPAAHRRRHRRVAGA
ncbi:hypothetical protein J2W79_004800 [Methylorubrum extorquens]|nr:hypothetical protein [Methylorubrum extorquens]